MEATKKPSARIMVSTSKPVQKKNWAQKINAHYEALITATSFAPRVVISYARFCAAVSSYKKGVSNDDCIRALTIAIRRSTCSGNILLSFDLTESLKLLIVGDKEEHSSLQCAIYSNKIDCATKFLNRRGGSVFSAGDLIDIDSSPLHPDVEYELRKRKSVAQVQLGILFKQGKYKVPDSASRAIEIYQPEWEYGNGNVAYNLERLFQWGLKYIPADSSRARKLSTQATNERFGPALNKLARLYTFGRRCGEKSGVCC